MYQFIVDLLGITPTSDERFIIISVCCITFLLAVDVLFRLFFAPIVRLMGGNGSRL